MDENTRLVIRIDTAKGQFYWDGSPTTGAMGWTRRIDVGTERYMVRRAAENKANKLAMQVGTVFPFYRIDVVPVVKVSTNTWEVTGDPVHTIIEMEHVTL